MPLARDGEENVKEFGDSRWTDEKEDDRDGTGPSVKKQSQRYLSLVLSFDGLKKKKNIRPHHYLLFFLLLLFHPVTTVEQYVYVLQ